MYGVRINGELDVPERFLGNSQVWGQDHSYTHSSGPEAKNRLKMGVLECLRGRSP